jgi:hypothetical protein
METEKVYYLPGDRCIVRHDIPNKPIMIVKRKVTRLIRPGPSEPSKDFLQGIVCYWFTTTGEYRENIFSTKDLEKS